MKRKIYFELFSTAKYNGELIGADCEKYLCPLSRIVHNCGYKGLFLVSGGPSSGKSSNITSFKIHLIKEHKEFIYYDLAELNFKTLTKPKNIPHNCIVIFDSLDEVQSRRCVRNAERLDGIRKEAEELINSFTNDENVVCVIIGSRFNPSRTKIEGYSNNFLKEFEEIVLSELTSDQIDALIEKFKLNVERDSSAYTLFKTPMYLSMAVEMGEVDKEIEDEASFIEAYLNKVHQTKQPQNDKKDSFVNGSLFELAYETIRGRICNKDISIPTAFNSIFGLSIEEEGKFLTSSSIRYINFSAAKYIVNKLYQLYQEDDIDEKHVKRLLDFVVESDNLEVLKFAGELLRHHHQKESIVQALNVSRLKQDADWYFNLCLIIFGHILQIDDNVFALGNVFPAMYCKRIPKLGTIVVMYSDLTRYPYYDYWHYRVVLKAIQSRSSKYIKKTEVDDFVYIGCEDNPFAVLAGYKHAKDELIIKNGCQYICNVAACSTGVSLLGHYEKSDLKNIVVEGQNEAYKSIDGVLFSSDMKKLIKYPGGQKNTRYKIPETVEIIVEEAFAGCYDICDIVLPLSLREIGYAAFASCKSLKQITIPYSVVRINGCAFSNCTSLKNIILPSGLSHIGWWAFSDCDSLEEICLPESVVEIGGFAFSGCKKLLNLTLPSKIETISSGLLSNAEKIESLVLPKSVNKIEDGAFSGMGNLKELFIYSDNISFDVNDFSARFMFWECKKLEYIYLSKYCDIPSSDFYEIYGVHKNCRIVPCLD